MSDNKSCSQSSRQITKADLPLCCPPTDQVLWNAHPRVYLPIEATGQVICPYCSTHYELRS